jgi:hypothetical protein
LIVIGFAAGDLGAALLRRVLNQTGKATAGSNFSSPDGTPAAQTYHQKEIIRLGDAARFTERTARDSVTASAADMAALR